MYIIYLHLIPEEPLSPFVCQVFIPLLYIVPRGLCNYSGITIRHRFRDNRRPVISSV